MTPILIWVFNINPLTTVATDLWFAVIIKIFAASSHLKFNLIDWKVTKQLWVGSISAVLIVMVFYFLGIPLAKDKILTKVIGLALILTSLGILFSSLRVKNDLRDTKHPWLTSVAGAFIGFLVGLTSIGAGALGNMALLKLYPSRMQSLPRLVATDIVHSIPLALVAAVGYLLAGEVNFEILGSLLLGGIPGILIGSHFLLKSGQFQLKILLGIVLLLTGVKSFLS